MNITDEDLGSDTWRLTLEGRMDIEGVGRIETRFAGMCAAPRTRVIVDMAAVPFMSSIGIRALLMNAKALGKRGGKMVVVQPVETVRSVLVSSGVDRLIPIFDSLDDARAGVAA